MCQVQIHFRPAGHDTGRVDALVAAVIMFLDVAEMACPGDARDLVQFS